MRHPYERKNRPDLKTESLDITPWPELFGSFSLMSGILKHSSAGVQKAKSKKRVSFSHPPAHLHSDICGLAPEATGLPINIARPRLIRRFAIPHIDVTKK